MLLVATIGGEVVMYAQDGCGAECSTELTIEAAADAADSCHNCVCVGTATLGAAPAIAPLFVWSSQYHAADVTPTAPAVDIFLPPRRCA